MGVGRCRSSLSLARPLNSGPICIISWRLSEVIHRCYLLRVVCYWCMGASMHGDRKCGVNVLY